MSLAQILEAIAALVLSSYFIIITFSFFRFRLSRKKEELSSLIESLQLDQGNFDLQKNFDKEFSRNDYLLPVLFVSLLSFFGIFLLLLGWMLYDKPAEGELVKSMLWSGSDFWNDPIYGREKKSLAVVGWALFGGYLSGGQYIYRRFSTIDLTPGNFFSIGIRMVLAPVVSLMLSYLITSDDPSSLASNAILVIAFLTGMFPERGLKLLLDKATSFFPSKNSQEVENLPLEAIEGISYLHRLRLNEVGIDNVQNLAQFNFLLLIIKTPFPARILLDWVSQAKLLMEFREYAPQLHKVGIRSALDYLDALEEDESRLAQIAKITELEPLMLEINHKNLQKDKSVWLLDHFKKNLEQVSLK
ncbi:MAG: hypothetical protein HEP71_07800 [Roseivirga sp.]|nr:hypothetical protein [Roseivirga sp.]